MTSGGTSQQTRAPRPAGGRPAGSPYTTGSMLRGATAMGVTAAVALVVVATVALGSATGQRLDRRAMDALSSPLRTTHRLVEVLSLVSVWSVALVLAACVVLALLRRRVAAAVAAMVLVAGANVTTQVLKYDVLTRPDIGFGSTNSLPSGHTTVAVSLALAGVLVAPAALRSLVALLGSGGATLIGAGTVVGRWHRPGDVVAGVAVCLLWAALALAVLALLRRDGAAPGPGLGAAPPHLTRWGRAGRPGHRVRRRPAHRPAAQPAAGGRLPRRDRHRLRRLRRLGLPRRRPPRRLTVPAPVLGGAAAGGAGRHTDFVLLGRRMRGRWAPVRRPTGTKWRRAGRTGRTRGHGVRFGRGVAGAVRVCGCSGQRSPSRQARRRGPHPGSGAAGRRCRGWSSSGWTRGSSRTRCPGCRAASWW